MIEFASETGCYSLWAEPLRVGGDDNGNARYRQNRRGVLPSESWWHGAPCGHPQSPVAWLMPDGAYVCHCAELLAMTDLDGTPDLLFPPNPTIEHPDGAVLTCENCGCYVLVIGVVE